MGRYLNESNRNHKGRMMMSHQRTLLLTTCLAAFFLTACCLTPPKGRYEPGPPNEAAIRIYLKADGTMIRAEGVRGGIWEAAVAFSDKPRSVGTKLADIELWTHDGTETDLKNADGTSSHPHSGPVNPPWNTHCHRYVTIDSQWVLVHC
jgi:hypothetical protein